MTRVLVTAVGGPAGASVAALLREDPGVDVGTVDAGREVPHGDDPTYPRKIEEAARGFDLVVPCSDPEVLAISRRAAVPAMLPPSRTIEVCCDKARLYRRLMTLLPVPRHMVGAFVKPRRGSGGKGTYPIGPDHVVCEVLPGEEFSVDAVFAHGRVRAFVVRRRDEVMGGVCRRALVLCPDNPTSGDVRWRLELLGHVLELHGPACVQFKRDAAGTLVLTDLNLRFGGGVTISAAAGVNLPRVMLEAWRGEAATLNTEPRPGIYAATIPPSRSVVRDVERDEGTGQIARVGSPRPAHAAPSAC